MFLAHVIVRLKRAVDDILSLNKLSFERLDSVALLVSSNSHTAAAVLQFLQQEALLLLLTKTILLMV